MSVKTYSLPRYHVFRRAPGPWSRGGGSSWRLRWWANGSWSDVSAGGSETPPVTSTPLAGQVARGTTPTVPYRRALSRHFRHAQVDFWDGARQPPRVQLPRQFPHFLHCLVQADKATIALPPTAPAYPARKPLQAFAASTVECHHYGYIRSVRATSAGHLRSPAHVCQVRHRPQCRHPDNPRSLDFGEDRQGPWSRVSCYRAPVYQQMPHLGY